MADTKITQLQPPQVGYPVVPATDVLPIVVIADPGMATSGSTRKVTVNQLLGAGGTATLASATITGDLTVRTNKLFVNATGVGVNYTSPAVALHVGTTGATNKFCINTAVTNAGDIQLRRGAFIGFSNAADAGNSEYIFANAGALEIGVNASTRFAIASDGVATWSNVGGTSGTAMTLNSTGLGVGGVPTGTAPTVLVEGIAGTYAKFNSKVGAKTWSAGYRSGTLQYEIQEDGTERFVIANGGNVGIGVTPSAGKGCLQLSSGINFPATQVASSDANTLDDYEEGTWTGTLKGSVSDPTTPVTATGKYTKIGRQVFVEITFNGVNTTGASGNITVTGLTFPCGSNINGVGVVSLNQIGTFTGSPYVFLSQSTSVLELYGNVSAGAGAAITHNAGALRYMTISLTYTV